MSARCGHVTTTTSGIEWVCVLPEHDGSEPPPQQALGLDGHRYRVAISALEEAARMYRRRSDQHAYARRYPWRTSPP